ncbi:MAG: caspase family protein [bacterium]
MRNGHIRLFVILTLLSFPLFWLSGCSESTITGDYRYLSTPTPSPGPGFGTLEGYVIASNGKSAPAMTGPKAVSVPLGFHVLPSIRVVLASGEATVTDAQGRFYFPKATAGNCAVKIYASDAGYYKDFTQNVNIVLNASNYINKDPLNPFIVAVSRNVSSLELYADTNLSQWPKVVATLRVVDNTPPMPVDIPCISKDNFSFLLNGTTPYTDFTMVSGADNRYTFTITVPPGNRNAKLSLTFAGVVSSTVLDFSEEFGITLALLVGINTYQFVSPDLPECKPDAVDTYQSLTGSKLWEEGRYALLTDDLSTKANIKSDILALSGVFGPKDTFFLVISSHGTNDGNKGYLIPYDAKLDDPSTLISGDELKSWLETIRKPGEFTNIAVALDSCFSGMFIGKGPQAACSKYVPMPGSAFDFKGETPLKQLQEMPDAVVITASAGTETSLTAPSLGHSLCMNFLIEGLGRGAVIGPADLNHDGKISMAELYEYAEPLVVNYASQIPHEQHPQFYPGPLGRELIIKY